ncbi:MAG TPA: FkbM family methyltransferase, partial [Myxococcales bacterium]|nr:FkbM family methyltransferase [Myxococcales bacterium]
LKTVLRPQDTLIDPAIGAAPGNARLLIGEHAETATLSTEFLRAYGSTDKTTAIEEQQVCVTTLDSLIERFGIPSFIKIDIEGFELEALRGLSQAPPALSFEINERLVPIAVDVVRRLETLSDSYWFRLSPYEHYRWTRKPALKAGDFIDWLSSAELPKTGDIYAFIDKGPS